MKKLKVGIIGGAGYTGGELVRLLLNHDHAEIVAVQSRSQAGKTLASVHRDLLGDTNLAFVENIKPFLSELDALFLALPHGKAKAFLEENELKSSTRVIDLSQDFRLKNSSKLGSKEFVYGLPELHREQIKKATYIANPGCFATAIELALLPLAKAGSLHRAVVTGITGATGAGAQLSSTSHFSFRANNIQAYKTLTHQHMGEVEESLHFAAGTSDAKVSFVPWRGDFTRGIFVSAVVESKLSKTEALSMYQSFYESHPFVAVTGDAIDLKSVVNTNHAQIEINQEAGQLVIHVAIDNLLKGASGQAVQNFNLSFGLPEMSGLKLKGAAF